MVKNILVLLKILLKNDEGAMEFIIKNVLFFEKQFKNMDEIIFRMKF